MCLRLLILLRRFRRLASAATSVAGVWLIASTSAAQPGLGIEHDPLECIPISDFAAFDAVLAPPDQVETCRLFFRSNISPDFYFVDMSVTLEDGLFRAYLPKPTAETSKVEYYLECLATDFANARTIGHEAEVVETADECRRRRPGAAYFVGDNPSIVVGSLNPAASLSPPAGFSLEGLAVSGSGLSRGAVVAAVGGAVVAGITAGVLASGDDPPAPLNAPPVMPPPVGVTPPPRTPVKACFEMNPASGMVAIGETVGLDASCSSPSDLIYTWQLGDGRTRNGVFTRPTYRQLGSFEVKLSVRSMSDPSQSDETTMPLRVENAVADLQVQKFARAICGGDTENIEVRVKSTNNGPNTAKNVLLTDTIPSGYAIVQKPGRCDEVGGALSCRLGDMENGEMQELVYVLTFAFFSEDLTFRRLSPFPAARISSDTADPGIGNNESAVDFGPLTCFSEESELRTGPRPIELRTTLEGATTGRVQVNGRQTVMIPGGVSLRARVQGTAGTNRFEAQVAGQATSEGFWTFGFGQSQGFVPGTLRVESGDVVSLSPESVTFRIGRGVGPPMRFTFAVER